jgi:hypothetical protein
MSGNSLGYLKGKMGLKGKTAPGQMITAMNKMKGDSLKKTMTAPINKTIKKII